MKNRCLLVLLNDLPIVDVRIENDQFTNTVHMSDLLEDLFGADYVDEPILKDTLSFWMGLPESHSISLDSIIDDIAAREEFRTGVHPNIRIKVVPLDTTI